MRSPGRGGRPSRHEASRLSVDEAAYLTACRLLARRPRSEAATHAALAERGFPAEVTARTLARLRDRRYLDDRALGRDRAELLRARGFGPRRIAADLERIGLSAAAAVESPVEERARARRVLARRFPDLPDRRSRVRAARYLLGRGFGEDVVREVVGIEDRG